MWGYERKKHPENGPGVAKKETRKSMEKGKRLSRKREKGSCRPKRAFSRAPPEDFPIFGNEKRGGTRGSDAKPGSKVRGNTHIGKGGKEKAKKKKKKRRQKST